MQVNEAMLSTPCLGLLIQPASWLDAEKTVGKRKEAR
jgi:hypothetical protein